MTAVLLSLFLYSTTPDFASVDTVQGIDMSRLSKLVDEIRDEGTPYPEIHSLLVMRGGELVLEKYFNGSYNNDLHTIQSVTKSITSAAIGIAIDDGLISNVSEKMVDFFPEQRSVLVQDERRARMRLEDILTMRTGTDYNENGTGSPHFQLNDLTTGWDDFWLARPMVNEPGGFWRYDSGGVIALSAMLKDRYGSHADVYIDEKLFSPLGITRRKWFRNQELHPHTGGGLNMRALDLLKIGQLYLQKGKWNGQQLISEAWIDASFKRHYTFSNAPGSTSKRIGYGYLWWLLQPDPAGDGTPIYAAMGYRGQYIFIIPEHDMVVVVTSWMPVNISSEPVNFLYSDILPAVVAPITTSNEDPGSVPGIGILEHGAPNPARGFFTVGFSLPSPGSASVILYDILGRRVQDLFSGFVGAAHTEITVDTSDLPSGLYLYRLESKGWSDTKKVIVSN
jgi:CubicO group peptidase (beta-lactamase class C family)